MLRYKDVGPLGREIINEDLTELNYFVLSFRNKLFVYNPATDKGRYFSFLRFWGRELKYLQFYAKVFKKLGEPPQMIVGGISATTVEGKLYV